MNLARAIRTPVPRRRATTRADQGRLEPVCPTIEHLRHKANILGGRVDDRGKAVGFDVGASVWPLDVYLRREVIEPKHHRAGMRYACDRFSLYGPCVASSVVPWREVVSEHIGEEDPPDELTEDEHNDREFARTRRLREATLLLRSKGVWWIVRVVLLDGNFVSVAEERSLRVGLELLAQKWRIDNES